VVILYKIKKMKSTIIQEFKGTINGIEISDRELFYNCEYILEQLEDQFDIDLPTSFINDFIHAYKSIFYDLGSEYSYEFRSHMSSSSWDTDLQDITQLHFDIGSYYDTNAQFSEMNKNIRNWKNTYSKYPINLLKKK
jgi:hypothetical protein